jgi:hypothetical protein
VMELSMASRYAQRISRHGLMANDSATFWALLQLHLSSEQDLDQPMKLRTGIS